MALRRASLVVRVKLAKAVTLETRKVGCMIYGTQARSMNEAGSNCSECKRPLLILWNILVSFCRLLVVWQQLCPVEQEFLLEHLYPVLTELMTLLVEMRAAELQSVNSMHAWMFTPSMKDLLDVLSLPTSCIQAISKGTKVQIQTSLVALPSGFIAWLCCLVSGTFERKDAVSAGLPTRVLPLGTMPSIAEAQKCTTTVAQAIVECLLSEMGVFGESISLCFLNSGVVRVLKYLLIYLPWNTLEFKMTVQSVLNCVILDILRQNLQPTNDMSLTLSGTVLAFSNHMRDA